MDATKKNKALSDLYEEYQRLGLVNQNVRVGEFKNLINDFVRNENENLYSYTSNVFKKAANKATSVYVAEDDLWRIVAYNKELNTLKKAYPDLARRNLQDLKQEFSSLPHDRGTLSMARSSDPNSANSQFFICFKPAPFLDRQYTVFGKVISGMEYVDKIKRGDSNNNGAVKDPDKIISFRSE